MRPAFVSGVVLAGMGLACGAATGGTTNAALNAGVALVSGSTNGADLSTLTDGAFLPRGTQWQSGTVWWNGLSTIIEVDLGDVFGLAGASVQADDNDAYLLSYRNMDTGAFETLWDIPNLDGSGNGMQTRPDPSGDSAFHTFANIVVTDTIRIQAVSGDNNYALSEIQVFVPTPGSMALLGAAGLLVLQRRRRLGA